MAEKKEDKQKGNERKEIETKGNEKKAKEKGHSDIDRGISLSVQNGASFILGMDLIKRIIHKRQ